MCTHTQWGYWNLLMMVLPCPSRITLNANSYVAKAMCQSMREKKWLVWSVFRLATVTVTNVEINLYWCEILINREGGPYGKVVTWSFRTDRVTKERGVCKKTECKYFPVQDPAMEVNKKFVIKFLVGFLFFIFDRAFFVGCCCLPYLLTRSFCILFPPARHSFIVLLYN